jgi:hypothetical protein
VTDIRDRARECSIEDCSGKVSYRGRCSKHYRQWLSTKLGNCIVTDCGIRVKARGLCNAHYLRRWFHGDVNYTEKNSGQGLTAEERFWSRVDKSAGETQCWIWRGTLMNKGYGTLKHNYRRWLTHRFSLFLHLGREPVGLVLHSCDNPPCVNPAHLREGTHADNMRDAFERGRRTR